MDIHISNLYTMNGLSTEIRSFNDGGYLAVFNDQDEFLDYMDTIIW